MSKFIIDMPEGKTPQDVCKRCNDEGTQNCNHTCSEWHMHNAVKAVCIWSGVAQTPYRESVMPLEIRFGIDQDGKPVKLWCTEGE